MAKSYVLKADSLNLVTSKPGDPLRFKTFKKGDKLEGVSEDRVAELVKAGAAEEATQGRGGRSGKPGQSTAPKGEADPGSTVPAGSGSTGETLTADAAGDLTGDELDAALKERDLSTEGSPSVKQKRLVDALSA